MRPALYGLLLAAAAAAPARAQTELQQLQQQVAERDALIQQLLRRVEALEKRLPPAAAAPAAVAAQAPSPSPAPAPTAAAAPPATLSDEDGLRALEQALVRQGGLVLPPRALEVEAAYQYTHQSTGGLSIVSGPAGAQVADTSVRRHRHEASLGLRLGLPAQSQLAVHAPWVHTRTNTAANAVALERQEHASGIGDLQVQFSKQFTSEGPGHPAVLGAVSWKSATGDFGPGRPSTGSGFPSLQAELTAVKRQDPLVFFGGISYTDYRSRSYGGRTYEPGAAVGVRLGTLLAASPQSSLRIGIDLSSAGRTRVDGVATPGTDTLAALIELGVVSILNRRTSLDLNVGFGVTRDAPGLRVGVAVPYRFD